uniref:RNA binding protein with serine rich domain 1 n=1 Tax=Zosterops lateralis melanops TaxID=1220523 RepID=A0A8D2QND2_ZOSLA
KELLGLKKKSLPELLLKAPSPTKRKDRSEEKSKDRSKDKAATKESGEKDRGRDKTRKRRSASSGSSSTRWVLYGRKLQHFQKSVALFLLGCLGPVESLSKPPKRDEKERKRRSPSPRPTKVHVGRLTRNVTKDHIMEIFSTYGKIKMIDMPVDRLNPHLSKGYAYVEFENPDDAEKALKHMDGGQIDGQEITATAVLAPRPRPPPRRFSPPRRMLPPPPMWRRSPPRMRRR